MFRPSTENAVEGRCLRTRLLDNTEKVRYNYDPSTLKLTSKVFSNGMKTEYSYDREGRIQGMALRDAAGRIQKAVGYQWNTYGQLATRYLKGFELPEAVFVPVSATGNLSSGLLVQEYKYDAIGRLIAVECPDAPQLGESYAFDQSGNIVSKTVGGKSVEMTYDLANQLIAKSEQGGEATSFSYDAAGRMTGEAVKGVNVASYTYGYLDKVLSVNRQGSESARFQYDAAGMLVGKEKDGVRENWVWDGISLAARGKEVFVNEAHASGGVPIMASHLENGDDISADFLVNDYLGTTIANTSAESAGQVEGLLVASLGAGGDAAAQDNPGARFTGKPYDADMGAHVFPFRNYRTDIGRWMSSDPAGFPDGPNGHFYAPTPTSGIDPLGLATTYSSIINPLNVSPTVGNFAAAFSDAAENIASIAFPTTWGLSTTAVLNWVQSKLSTFSFPSGVSMDLDTRGKADFSPATVQDPDGSWGNPRVVTSESESVSLGALGKIVGTVDVDVSLSYSISPGLDRASVAISSEGMNPVTGYPYALLTGQFDPTIKAEISFKVAVGAGATLKGSGSLLLATQSLSWNVEAE